MSTGFVLKIDDKLLQNLEKADELVQDIGKHSEQTRDMFNNAFQSMATGSLDGFISKLMSARQAIQDIGDAKVSDKGLGSISTQAVQGADSVNNLVESITRLMQVAQGREKVQPIDINSIDIAEDNIESLREKIATLKRLLSQNRQGLIDETQQQNAKLLLDEINRLQVAYGNLRTEQKNLQTFDKVFSLSEDTISQTERKLAKMRELWSNLYKDPQKYEEELKKVTAEIQRLIKRKSDLKKLTTFEGAMDFSKSTKSIKDQIQAIKYLKAARENLSKEGMSEADYRKKVKELTDEIKRQQKEVDKLVGKNSDLGKSHKSLINTADQLKRAFALMFSVSAIRGYVTQIARVRGEFELQQRSLQAILQNKDEADRLWQQTVQLAVRSPFQVKELVTYTKQLAAYRVESDKLYDTTKMLADVSAGLGVDMNRLILAYGQVKAANYLRGTELRQFSEAGVNILAELAKYFTEVEGRAVSVGDVFERVSKRMVTFADVEEIFKRITSEGGVFYNMQEIQAETLKGQISNLRDAIDIMLNEIGQKNEHILKSVVGVVRTVVQNWEVLVPILKAVVAGFALTRVNALLAKESIMLMAIDLGVLVNAEQETLTVTQLLNVGWKSFIKNLKAAGTAAKAFVVSNPLITALMVIVTALLKVGSVMLEHKREIDEINKKYQDLGTTIKAISNKFYLAQTQKETTTLKKELNQLVELANREYNMDIKVDLSGLSTEKLAEKFIEIREKIFDVQEFSKTFELAMQKVASWTPDKIDIYGRLEAANTKATELYSIIRNNLNNLIYNLTQSSVELNESQTKALQELQKPQGINETQFQYITRVQQALKEMPASIRLSSMEAYTLVTAFEDWDKKVDKAGKRFQDLFDELDGSITKMSDEDKTLFIKTAIDKQGFTDIQRELAYFFANQRYGINITPTLPVSDKKDGREGGKLREEQFKRQLALIKKLRSEYLKLTNEMGKEDALKLIKEHYKDAFDQIFQGTGVDWDFIFDASEKGYVTALGELRPLAEKAGKAAKDAFEKELSGSAINVEIKTKSDAKKQLKQQVDSLFAQFDLSRELEKLGLSKGLIKSLFDVEYLDLDSLKSQVIEKFAGTTTELQTELKKDVSTIDWAKIEELIGKERAKEAKQSIEKITDMEAKAAKERVKTYVKYLMEAQREAVKIRIEELRKLKEIEESKEFSPEQKQQIKDRVRKETNAELQKQEWADFQNSEMYTMMFEDLEHYGTQALETLREKLIALKGSLTDLPASEVKEIINQLSKIEDITIERNPFRALKETRKQIKAEGVSEKQAQTNLAQSENEIAKLQSELDIINIVNTAKAQGLAIDEKTQYAYDGIVVEMADMGVAEADIVKHKENSLKAENENAQAAKKTLDIYERQGKARIATLNRTKDILGSVQDAIKASMELMDSFGVSTDSIGYTLAESTDSMISLTISAIEFTIQLKAMGIAANSALGIIGWIAIGIQAVAKVVSTIFKMHDAGLQKQIDDLAVQTEDLQEKFDALNETIDNAYNTDQLRTAAAEGKQYTEQMISNYEKMKQLEEDKKKTDKDAVKEYEDNIKEQRKALRELEQQIVSEATAGILDNAADAARGFVDAWYDAFKETGNGLKGLEDNFDEMFLELAKQQATMQIAGNFAKQWEKDLSKYINETDTELTKAEAQEWAEKVKATFPALNDALEGFLGVVTEGVGATGELSGLEKGIAGASEETVQVLSAYANSCRFLLSNINTTLSDFATKVFDTEGDSNPILAQLRIIAQQTSAMRTLLDSVTQSGHPKGQSGIRVFID
jgi:flagellar biosynthesis regulator FlbT